MRESARHIIRDIYSEVLFELANQHECLDSVTEDLTRICEMFKAEPEFAAILTSLGIEPSEKAQIIRRVFEGKVDDLTLNFLSVLARRNRIGLLGSISDRYELLVDTHRGRALVEVTVSKALDDKQMKKFKADLTVAINKDIKLSVLVEPAIIGGIIIKKDDTVIDNSVRNALQGAVATVVENLKDMTDEV